MQYWKKTAKYFLYGIAGIGKSELAKAYAKTYRKEYTNILYLMYSGNLRQDIIDLDFADDLPEDTEASKNVSHGNAEKINQLVKRKNFMITNVNRGAHIASPVT